MSIPYHDTISEKSASQGRCGISALQGAWASRPHLSLRIPRYRESPLLVATAIRCRAGRRPRIARIPANKNSIPHTKPQSHKGKNEHPRPGRGFQHALHLATRRLPLRRPFKERERPLSTFRPLPSESPRLREKHLRKKLTRSPTPDQCPLSYPNLLDNLSR